MQVLDTCVEGSTPSTRTKCVGDVTGKHLGLRNQVLRVRLPPFVPNALVAQLAEATGLKPVQVWVQLPPFVPNRA